MKNSEIVAAARELIDTPDKWTKGGYCSKSVSRTAYCVEGAIRSAIDHNFFYGDGVTRSAPELPNHYLNHYLDTWHKLNDLNHAISQMAQEMALPSDIYDLSERPLPWHFNDHDQVTHDDIMALMDKTIAHYQERGE